MSETAPVTMHVVPHSHWDREWYRPFQSFRLRLVELVDYVLDLMESDPGWTHFMLDGQTATATDYLAARPENAARLRQLLKDGRMAIGPWHILMDEFLVSGETTVRNLQLGQRLAEELGGVMPVGYLPDMFGHISQMPQILRLGGLADAVLWRGVPAAVDRTAFEWSAPDGSTVRTAYLATSYSNGAGLPIDTAELEKRASRIRRDLEPFAPGEHLLVMAGTDHQFPPAGLPKALATASNGAQMRISSLADYIAAHRGDPGGAATLPAWVGELRSGARANLLMGVVSNRMDLRALVARAERELERYAEPLQALVAPTLAPGLLDIAWRSLIENSAHDSVCACSVDDVTDQVRIRWLEAHQIASGLSERALTRLARSVSVPPGPAFVVWNPSLRPRRAVVELDLEVPPEWGELVAVDSTTGETGAVQELSRTEPVAVDVQLPAALVPQALDMVQGRNINGEWVNAVDIRIESDSYIEAEFTVDWVPRGHLDVDAEVARMRQLAGEYPNAVVRVLARRPTRRRLLVETPVAGGLGWTSVLIKPLDHSTTGPTPPPALTLAPAPEVAGWVVPTIADGGDVGDTYNYCWPEPDTITTGARTVADESIEDTGFRRHRRVTVEHESIGTVTFDVRSLAGDPTVAVVMAWSNERDDHRVRVHLPLPETPTLSVAGGPFSRDTRGLTAEGGPTEVALATFPARDVLHAGGLSVALPQVTEYEVLASHGELALTALRSTGTISRGPMASRPMPAGPDIPTPNAQCRGPQRFAYAVFAGSFDEDGLDGHLHPVRAAPVDRLADATMPARQDGPKVAGPVLLSACRTRPQGGREVRVWNPFGRMVACEVDGGERIDLRGEPDAADQPGALRPYGIATFVVT